MAVADKVRRAITSALNARVEQFVQEHVHTDNIEEATNSLFSLISKGAKEEDIEKELSRLSSKIAEETIERT